MSGNLPFLTRNEQLSGSSPLVGSLVYCESTPSASLISVACSGNLFACLEGVLPIL
jgi:hypothetical protein